MKTCKFCGIFIDKRNYCDSCQKSKKLLLDDPVSIEYATQYFLKRRKDYKHATFYHYLRFLKNINLNDEGIQLFGDIFNNVDTSKDNPPNTIKNYSNKLTRYEVIELLEMFTGKKLEDVQALQDSKNEMSEEENIDIDELIEDKEEIEIEKEQIKPKKIIKKKKVVVKSAPLKKKTKTIKKEKAKLDFEDNESEEEIKTIKRSNNKRKFRMKKTEDIKKHKPNDFSFDDNNQEDPHTVFIENDEVDF